jgi:hypothetical protein
MWTQLSTHAKEAIRLRADIDTLSLDLRQLLEAEPVDLPQMKQALQTIAGKEAELRFVHITAMQEMGKGLTPEQRQKLRAMRTSMMGPGGMMGHGGFPRSWLWPIFLLLALWSILIRCLGPQLGLVGIGESKAVIDGAKRLGKRTLCFQHPATLPWSPHKATIALYCHV